MNIHKRQRFPPDIISYAVWLYCRFNLGHRDIEDLLAERGITVSQEAIRLWCIKLSAIYTRRLKRKHRGYADVVDVYLQAKRDGPAANRFFIRLLRSYDDEPRTIVKDKRQIYGVAHRDMMSDLTHDKLQYVDNRAEQSHEATRGRERGVRRFKSVRQAQRFVSAHAALEPT